VVVQGAGRMSRVGVQFLERFRGCHSTLHHTPFTAHPTLFTLQPAAHTLHPAPYTLHPTTLLLFNGGVLTVSLLNVDRAVSPGNEELLAHTGVTRN
jgi:hypothetical protein